jgi:hypothetical protein
MNHEETLDNLWIVFAPRARARVFHTRSLPTPHFVPI